MARTPLGGRWLVWAGAGAHLGGAAAIGWSAGIGVGLAAGVLIPVVASALYSVVVNPMARTRRLRRRAAGNPRPQAMIRQY